MKALVIGLISTLVAGAAAYCFYAGGVHIYIVTGDGAHHIGTQSPDNSQSTIVATPVPTPATSDSAATDPADKRDGSGGAANPNGPSDAQPGTSESDSTHHNANSVAASSEAKTKRRRRRYRPRYYVNPYNECTCPPGEKI